MSHADYLAEVRHLPRPTDTHIDAFVSYVASAHSWYKHLPILPPGKPFTFYVDPNAGREWVHTDIAAGYRDRASDTPANERFHYTWQPTAQYLQRFGHLQYHADAGSSFMIPVGGRLLDTRTPDAIQASDGRWIALPAVLRLAGTVRLTAVIYQDGLKASFCLWRLAGGLPGDPTRAEWHDLLPDDDPVLAKILELAGAILDEAGTSDAAKHLPAFKELRATWLPAYALQQKQRMRDAIHRAIAWVYEGA